MEFVEYQFEKKYLSEYTQLIQDIYFAYPMFVKARVSEVQKALNKDNPFLKFGTWKNFLIKDKGKSVSHISAIIDSRMPSGVGLVGYFDSKESCSYAKEAFKLAGDFLSSKGIHFVRGPVDLTTWKSFRVSYPEGQPPFLLEPFTRGYYRKLFEDHGFKVVQKNISTTGTLNQMEVEKFEKSYNQLQKQGLNFCQVQTKDVPNILPQIWKISNEIFRDSWSFVSVGFDEFIFNLSNSDNQPLSLDIACDGHNKVVAFSLSARDSYAGERKRVVVKTLGALSDYQKLGIGRALLYSVYSRAREDGIEELIFSTMRLDNGLARNLAGRTLDVYREYAVYELML